MKHKTSKNFIAACPIPLADYPNILLAHGGGGKLMRQLIDKIFVASFENDLLEKLEDGAVFSVGNQRLAFTTDSYVVRPIFFPGGDIGTLAVNGTVNDLAMCGARPLYLSAGFILEEGLPMETLWRVTQSMKHAAEAAGIQVVTGDTKVVERKNGDEILINTSGIGIVEHGLDISPAAIQAGDAVLLNGDIGRHGIAIMAQREGFAFENTIESDCADLSGLVGKLLQEQIEIRCLRDLTRGGLGAVLVEIAEAARLKIHLAGDTIPVCEAVRGACEMLGLDPLYVANEGRFAVFVSSKDAERALHVMRDHPLGRGAARIGGVVEKSSAQVTLKSEIGATRIVDMPRDEQLPRIC